MNSRVPSNGADQLTSLPFAEVCKGCSRRGGRPSGPWSWRLSVTVSLACPGSPLLLLPHVHEVRLQGAAAELAPVCLPRHQRSSTAHPGRTADPARVSRPLPPFVFGGAGWSGAEQKPLGCGCGQKCFCHVSWGGLIQSKNMPRI